MKTITAITTAIVMLTATPAHGVQFKRNISPDIEDRRAERAGNSDVTTNDHPGVVNINTATEEQYQLLPGVGPKLASVLNDYAEANGDHKDGAQGAFKTIDDLLNVKGIGKKKLEQLRPYVVLSGQTTATKKIKTAKR